jgi:hypothetical protein
MRVPGRHTIAPPVRRHASDTSCDVSVLVAAAHPVRARISR